jgi:hypothetical protein
MPGADFSPDVLAEMAEGDHTYGTPARFSATQVNSAFVELSGLVDGVNPFVAWCHLKRCIESLREAASGQG